jgi:hypothetical protein
MKALVGLIAFTLFLLCLPVLSPAVAVSLMISSYPSSVSIDPFNISVSVQGASEGNNYLRADLYKEGTVNYFGETFNGSSWYMGSDGKSFYPITVVSSSASALLQIRIGNPSIAEFTGSGLYKLKIRRYTASGSLASSDTQTPVDVTINYSTPTPVPTAAPTQTPTVSPTTIPSLTNTPTPIPTLKNLPSPTITSIASPTDFDENSPQSSVLGSHDNEPLKNENKAITKISSTSYNGTTGIIFIGLGVIFLAICGILFFHSYKQTHADKIT